MSDTAARQFSGSLVLVLHEIWIKCIHPSTYAHIYTHTHTRYMHKLFVHYTVASRFFLRNQIERETTIIIYIRSSLSDVHIFLFFHQQYTHTHSYSSFYIFQQKKTYTHERNKKKKKKDFICIDDNSDDLYVLHLTATGEVQQWNAFVDADNRWDRENERAREEKREKKRERENEKNLTFV